MMYLLTEYFRMADGERRRRRSHAEADRMMDQLSEEMMRHAERRKVDDLIEEPGEERRERKHKVEEVKEVVKNVVGAVSTFLGPILLEKW